MKELCREDLTNHPGPESCTCNRKIACEALTGEVQASH